MLFIKYILKQYIIQRFDSFFEEFTHDDFFLRSWIEIFFWRCKDCKQSNTNWFFSRPRPIKKENFSHQTFLGILLTTATYLLDVFFRNGIDLLCSVTVCVFFLLLQLVLASGWLFLQWMRITILTFRAFRKVFDLLIGLYLC